MKIASAVRAFLKALLTPFLSLGKKPDESVITGHYREIRDIVSGSNAVESQIKLLKPYLWIGMGEQDLQKTLGTTFSKGTFVKGAGYRFYPHRNAKFGITLHVIEAIRGDPGSIQVDKVIGCWLIEKGRRKRKFFRLDMGVTH